MMQGVLQLQAPLPYCLIIIQWVWANEYGVWSMDEIGEGEVCWYG